MFKVTEILDAFRMDGLDSHQPSMHRPLADAGYPPCGGGNVIGASVASVGDPVALRQKATASGNFLEPM